MTAPTLTLLGPFGLAAPSGDPVTVPGRKARALLAYLALEPDPHRRKTLVGLLWPEMPDADARNNLRVTVARLRRSLTEAGRPTEALRSDRHTVALDAVALDADALDVDARRFDRLLAEVAEHDHDARCDRCFERRGEAAALLATRP